MHKFSLNRTLALLVCFPLAFASKYTLVDNYEPSNFFSKFRFETGGDPTHGFVQYVNESYASSHGLIKSYNDYVTIGVDSINVLTPDGGGRPSVRLASVASYTRALYVLSLSHMPYGCGTWPAFWSLGPNWPSHGEIDIIEGVNTDTKNLMSLHTSNGCTIAGTNQTGTLETSNCYEGVDSNAGCSVQAVSTASYGSDFNANGGGVYVMEWTADYIRVWFFDSKNIPSTITSADPDPATFGTPSANFQGSCDINSHFGEHNIIFDITFCGDFAGNTYGGTACPMTSGASGYESCIDFVANNPNNFTEAFWKIGSLKVYQKPSEPALASTFSTASLSSATAAASTNSAILSSLSNAGQGVDTTKTPIASSTLSLPETTSSSTTIIPSSTYPGPNTVMMNTTYISSLSGNSTSTWNTGLSYPLSTTSLSTTSTYAPIWASSMQSTRFDSTSGWVTPYASSASNPTRTSSSQQYIPTTSDVPECHSFFSSAGGGLYRIYCNATIAGNDLKDTTAYTFQSCVESCDLYNSTCTGVVFANSSFPPLCTIKTSASHNSTYMAKRAPLVSWANDVYAALRVEGSSFSVPDDPTSQSIPSYATSTISSIVTSMSVITSTLTTTRPGPTCGTTAIYTTIVSLCFTCALTPTVISTTIPVSLPTCARTANTEHPYSSIATSATFSVASPITCPARKSVTVTKYVQTTVTTCVMPLTCPAKSTGLDSGSGSNSGSYGSANCSSGLTDDTIFDDAMGVQYQIFCSKANTGQPLESLNTSNIQSCMAACDMWNVMNFHSNDSCQAISYYGNVVTPSCYLHHNPGGLELQPGCDSGIVWNQNPETSTNGPSTGTMTSRNGVTTSSTSYGGGSGSGTTKTGTIGTGISNGSYGSGSGTGLGTGPGSGTVGGGGTGSGGTGGPGTGPVTGGERTVTVTGPGSTVYITEISTVISYSTSYVYETQTEKVTATVTPSSIASTSSKYCRTLATHYEAAVRRDSLFQGADARGIGYLEMKARQEMS